MPSNSKLGQTLTDVNVLTIHPTEIRISISPSSPVELNTTSALANYATEAVTGPPNPEEEKLFSRLWSPAQRTSLASTAANPSFSLGMEFTYCSFKMQLVSTFVLFAALMWFSAEATEVKACQVGGDSEWDVTLLEGTLNGMSRCWRVFKMEFHVVGGYSEWDVTLLEGTQNGMSRCWRVLRMECHVVGGYSEWDVTLLEGTQSGMSRCWRILIMGCHVVGGYSEWNVSLLEDTYNGMSRCWRVLRMECHLVGGYSEWNVTLLEDTRN
uniref:Uncharacterized protein n=1 Tax=Timema douglasi TaxID=61478 RepID=A0A7R8VFE7_TIMDO|nr:unnamed protein product [Timema douglasi]